MKKSTTYLLFLTLILSSSAQGQIWKKIEKAAKRGVERTIEKRTEKDAEDATNDVYDILGGKKKGTGDNDNQQGSNSNKSIEHNNGLEDNSSLEESGSNQVGFNRGSRIIFSDSFERDAIGDFPAKWNTTKGGEVKKLNGFDEKWLKVPAGSKVYMELTKPLPKNFTVEMDVLMPSNIPYKIAGIAFMSDAKENLNYTLSPYENQGVGLLLYSHNDNAQYMFGHKSLNISWNHTEYSFPFNKRIKLAFEVNNHERFRVYADGQKIVDLPRTFQPAYANAIIIQALTHGAKETLQNHFYISNVVIAETGTDERSQVSKELLENGTFTTSDILFASGSDEIQSSSSSILNEIGSALQTAPSTQFLIIGHTDSDGDDAANKTLSQKRAEAVKNYLVQKFGLDSSQFMCVGKGESEPLADNKTSAGKAQNRRVEFKKL